MFIKTAILYYEFNSFDYKANSMWLEGMLVAFFQPLSHKQVNPLIKPSDPLKKNLH